MENSYTKSLDNKDKKDRINEIKKIIKTNKTVKVNLYNNVYDCKIVSLNKAKTSVCVYYDYIKRHPFYTTVWLENVIL